MKRGGSAERTIASFGHSVLQDVIVSLEGPKKEDAHEI